MVPTHITSMLSVNTFALLCFLVSFTMTALSRSTLSFLGALMFTVIIEIFYGVLLYFLAASAISLMDSIGSRRAFISYPVGSHMYILNRTIIFAASMGGWALSSLAFGRRFRVM